VASVADLLASALNPNLTAWRSAPAPVELERLTIDWIKEALGCEPSAGGLLMSGGSMANLTALAAARYRHCGEVVATQGAAAHPRPLRVYASTQAHHSTHKAAALLGIGRANVREVAVDDHFRMDVTDLVRQIEEDRQAEADPFAVVASAGTVLTGAVDPLADIAAVASEHGLWMHVDACYGGFACLAPSARQRFAGLAAADSIALDPHKWLYLPADCGCLIYRDPASTRAAFALDADYTRVMHSEPAEAFAFWDYGPDLSRRFRALKVWMTLAYAGERSVRRSSPIWTVRGTSPSWSRPQTSSSSSRRSSCPSSASGTCRRARGGARWTGRVRQMGSVRLTGSTNASCWPCSGPAARTCRTPRSTAGSRCVAVY
jgi:glutamate/tyrosine decarboxylase-like PLP-dependent enzyme